MNENISTESSVKQKKILEKLTKTETLTLHQLLLLKPNLEIEQLNIKE